MGLAASQGRMLLLTARKSDLEFRAQQISQRRVVMSQQLETVASDYARAIGNRKLCFVPSVNGAEANKEALVDLNYWTLVTQNMGGDLGSIGMRITNAKGQVLIPVLPTNEDGTVNEEALQEYFGVEPGDQYQVIPSLVDMNVFQYALRNGSVLIQQQNVQGEWEFKTWQTLENIRDAYYTDDDAYAQSIQERESAKIQAADKQLELELKQIDTQHKAIETEIDSVKKVMEKNIDSSFKMFQG